MPKILSTLELSFSFIPMSMNRFTFTQKQENMKAKLNLNILNYIGLTRLSEAQEKASNGEGGIISAVRVAEFLMTKFAKHVCPVILL